MKLAPIAPLIALLLAGCSAAQPATTSAPPPATSSVTPTEADTVDPEPTPTAAATNERGNVAKKLGEWATLVDGNGEVAVRVRVTKIEPGFRCNSEFAEKSKNGQFVAIWMDVQTTGAVDFDSSDAGVVPYFNTDDWEVVGTDGTTENDSSGNGADCPKDSIALPTQLGPNKKVHGVVVVDTHYRHGHLALVQGYAEGGWEWDF